MVGTNPDEASGIKFGARSAAPGLLAVAGDRLHLAVLGAVLSLSAILLCHHLTEPFTGLHEWQSAFMSAAARNHVRYGYAVTRLAVIENADVVPPEWFRYYPDHPPLVPVLVSLSFRVFGEHEWSARLVPIAFTLGSTLLIYLLGTELGGRRLGLLTAFIYALLPMNAYFGRMVSHEAPTSFFALAMALAYLRWHRTRRPALFGTALGALILGALCGWPAYYLAGILPLHHVVTARRSRERKVLLFPLTVILLFGLHLGSVYWLQGPTGLTYLASKFLFRTKLHLSSTLEALGITPAAVTFTWGQFLLKELGQAGTLFTPPVLILATLGLYDTLRRRGRATSDPLFMIALLLFGITHVALFPQAAWQHEYMLFYCSAPLALLAAIGASSFAWDGPRLRALGVVGLLFVLAALSTTRLLYRMHNADIYRVAPLVKQYTRSGEQVVTNGMAIYGEAPQIGYYAGRDVSYDPVFHPWQLERRLAAARRRPFAVMLSEAEQGGAELGPWLASRYSSQRAELLGRWYLVFHIRPDRD
jgi:4-amino-4-deoxy-L-arabinose transferase-like glycosyltransferase